MQLPDNLGSIIKTARELKGIRVEALAAEMDVGTRHIQSIEAGTGKPSYGLLFRLVRRLELPLEMIFYPEENPLDDSEIRKRQLVNGVLTGDDRLVSILHATYVASSQALYDGETALTIH